MDITLVHTFLNVLATESFVAAAERMRVTQSAVSLRIQKLEAQLGHRLFERSKSGVTLTASGTQFEHYARSLIQIWDEAIYQTALPEGFEQSLSLACQESLWPELSSRWLMNLSRKMPTTAFGFQTGAPQNIVNMLLRGIIDIAVLYNPEMRSGFEIEPIMEDRLVLVSAKEDHDGELGEDYIYADWGEEFAIAHARWYPGKKPPQIRLRLGPALPDFLIEYKKSAFMPYRIADDYVADGRLHFIRGAPNFPFPAYAIWTRYKDEQLVESVLAELREAAVKAPWIELDAPDPAHDTAG